jgi:methionyl-tRNA formyltransferase
VSPSGICVITAGGPYPWIIINALGKKFGPTDVLMEDPEPRSLILKRRARKIGWLATAGQFATMVLVRLGKRRFAARIERIVAENGLEEEPRPEHTIVNIGSINSSECLETLKRLDPKVVLLVGCRIVKADVLAAIACPVLNYHAGISPQYRGMNGGYWALASGDPGNFGTTVHLVDSGVDTGGILYQVRGKPAPDDNIMTYTHRLAALSRDICIRAVGDALAGKLATVPSEGPSQQWYHPTIWQYLATGFTRGVW